MSKPKFPPVRDGACGGGSTRRPDSIAVVVDAYIRDHRRRAGRELEVYAKQRCLREAVDLAARCTLPGGKRHPHQRRIPGASLEEARRRLIAVDLGACQSFEELHSRINSLIRDIHMVGPLAVYDIAHRIGAYLGLEPARVYLHAGTRDGARALGLGRGRVWIDISELPRPFRRLSAAEAEDCLCIYKEMLRRLSSAA